MSNSYQAEAIKARFLDPLAPSLDSQYIIATPIKKKNKTWVYEINTIKFATLGFVKWFPQWRRYAFFPDMTAKELVFSEGCLKDIAKFINRLMFERWTKNEN